ncbi:MAG: hypothetical protein DWQ34_03600 [Planctomycetota bacterium]|nr:MAG: hypothetical protein DWQ34_03600 [Planctomycetota bacterium]REK24719.1 MAG: hypothetical protein DWQ41_13360 [Planctomycetota bacterium]REK29990.1 MAG: hypothetical protein DWQ45_22045 [Planctomycetota bacterium]
MTSTVLDSVLEPVATCLTPESARRIADLRADPDTQAKLDEFADKANEGQLTVEERAEYDRMLAAFHVITILQAKARTLLERQGES